MNQNDLDKESSHEQQVSASEFVFKEIVPKNSLTPRMSMDISQED